MATRFWSINTYRPSAVWIAAVAWLLYVISFFLPAVELGTSDQLEPGWKAAATAGVALRVVVKYPAYDLMIVALWGLTNVLMVLSPVPIIRKWNARALNRASLVMLMALGLNALALLDRRRHQLGVGYYLWLCAFGLVSLAFWVRSRTRCESKAGQP